MQGILDFNREFDVSLMDRVVVAFYTGAGAEVRIGWLLGVDDALTYTFTATNGTASADSISRQSRSLDEGTGHPGAIVIPPNEGG